MINRALLTKPALIAAAAGATIGAGLGLWSVRHATSTRSAVPAAAVVEPVAVATNGTAVARSQVVSQSQSGSTSAKVAATLQAPGTDAETVRQRASMLAQKGDVTALLAMRDAVLRRAREQGEQASEATTHDLDDIDRYLVDARGMRLKLDGEALRVLDKQVR